MVLNTVSNGPAKKAGIRPGNASVEVDDVNMTSATANVVAA